MLKKITKWETEDGKVFDTQEDAEDYMFEQEKEAMTHHTDTELTPCPFCGGKAYFEIDDDRWQWVECGSCGMQGNRSASLMEDCKPKLSEAWNRRAPVVPQGLFDAIEHGDETHRGWLKSALDAFFSGKPIPQEVSTAKHPPAVAPMKEE